MGASLEMHTFADPRQTPPSLARYRALEAASLDALAAARRDDWHQVERIQANSRILIESLRSSDVPEGLTKPERQEKFRILRQLVIIDGQMQQLAQPWVRNLDAMLAVRPSCTA